MRHVRSLLMGGQACVLYGAAEFSRDVDLAVLADEESLRRLGEALLDLQAEVIAVPPFSPTYLERGHAIHFRCQHPEARGMRIDVMSKMRGVEDFPNLWDRRTTIHLPDGFQCDLLSLPDVVKAKKTQRNKDWPMIQRLVETHYFQNRKDASPEQVRFWLAELRTATLLIQLANNYPHECDAAASHRPLLKFANVASENELEEALEQEERREKEADRAYWTPLKAELEAVRHSRI